MDFNYRPYDVTVGFKNEGTVYGQEKYRIMAANEDQAERKAFANASGSVFDDGRIPDRKIVILECAEAEEDPEEEEGEDQAAAA